ncbi:uncharacterized protein [Eucyclogobius newberryi]|uniref:uncharacterized protein n=1 Tax=Eucyclogobius newberryi TaxID=166745 RepID=UPI003B5C3A76
MSLKSQTLRDLVVERLVVAANEIFELFERTFAEYEEEFLRSKSPRKPQKQDLLSSGPGFQSVVVPSEVKYEDRETPVEAPFSSFPFKSEEMLDKSCLRQQQQEEPTEQLYGEEEPGCSLDMMNEFEPYSCSDTENSEDWDASTKRKTKSNGQSFNQDSNEDFFSGNYQNPENSQYGWTESDEFVRKRENAQSLTYDDKEAGTQDRPFSCSVCTKTFPQKRNLKSHMRVHTGERPYHCVPCGLSFKFQQNFSQHDLTVHRKDKPFRCRVCKKDFVDKGEMIAHRNSHNSSISCSTCNKTFTCKKYLRRHLERCPRKKRTPRSFNM